MVRQHLIKYTKIGQNEELSLHTHTHTDPAANIPFNYKLANESACACAGAKKNRKPLEEKADEAKNRWTWNTFI